MDMVLFVLQLFFRSLYTTAAVDNINHNPGATTAKVSFHYTGISVFQFRNSQATGESHIVPVVDDTACELLQEPYTNISRYK